MTRVDRRHVLQGAAAVATLTTFGARPVRAAPFSIRLGYSLAAEEQLWLLMAKPDIGANYGKVYTLDSTRFQSSSARAQAFEAGAIDIASGSANGVLFAAAEGVPTKIIASLSKESRRGAFTTSYLAMANSPIKSAKDLKGKTVAVNGLSTSGELWLRAALEKAGLSEREVTVVPVSFPAMGESLRSGRIDAGEFPQPFAAMAEKEMKVKTIFTAKDAVPFDEELIVLIGKDEWLKAHADAVRAFLADLQASTRFYLDHTKEARQILIDKKFVRVPADIYLTMKDYYRDPTMRVSAESLEKMQDEQVSAGFQKKKADVASLVDLTYLPK